MGAGQFPAGLGPAGFDPSFVPSPKAPPSTPRSLKFDPSTRQFVRNSDGTLADVHPVDQMVVFLLFFEQNSAPSQIGLGMRLRKRVERVDPKLIPSICLDEVRATLRTLIDAKDILLVSVTPQVTPGRVAVAIVYVNLKDPATDIRNPISSAVRVVV